MLPLLLFNTLNLISPKNNSADTNLSVKLKWEDDINALNYDIQVATDSGFSNIISNGIDITTNSYKLNNLLEDTLYYWKVKPKNTCGEGVYSSSFNFSTKSPIYWTGTTGTNWSEKANWSKNRTPSSSIDDVIIPSTPINQPVVNDNTAEAKNIEIKPGASLKIYDGTLIVRGTTSGNITYNRELDGLKWSLVSSPVTDQTYDNNYVADNNIDHGTINRNRGIATYSTGSNAWSYMQADTDAKFIPGKGYSVKRNDTGYISFTGAMNTGDVSVAIVSNGYGFNLLGNPYTYYINSATFLIDNRDIIDSKTIWLWNNTIKLYETRVALESFKLSPTRGFFVKAKSDSNFNFKSLEKLYGKSFQNTELAEIKLLMTDGTSKRIARILYSDRATKGFDNGGDGEVFPNYKNSLDVYTTLIENDIGKKYQVQSLPNSDIERMIIPVGIKATIDKEITFSLESINIPSKIKIILEDRETKTYTRLDEAKASYKVTLTEDLNDIGRFYIHTTQSNLSVVKSKLSLKNISVYKINDATLRVVGLPNGNISIKLYNILGNQLINSLFESKGVKDIPLSSSLSGIYIVQIETQADKLVKKIVLK